MGPGTKKYRVTLDIEVSSECMNRVDNGTEHPEDFVRAELGWASESFDGMEVRSLTDISEGQEPSVEQMVEDLLHSGDNAVYICIYGYGRGYISDATESDKFEQEEFRDKEGTPFQEFRKALRKVWSVLKK